MRLWASRWLTPGKGAGGGGGAGTRLSVQTMVLSSFLSSSEEGEMGKQAAGGSAEQQSASDPNCLSFSL